MNSKIRLIAEKSAKGTAYEEVIVRITEVPGHVVLVHSPGLILGVAAGDTLKVDVDGNFAVVRRGGNLCIQIFFEAPTSGLEEAATNLFLKIGGWLDGKTENELVYTVGIERRFDAIESALSELNSCYPTIKWYYGNVYDPVDGVTPLNWWLN